jgi:hypothetical protein
MRTFSAPVLSALASPELALVQLIYIALPSAPIALNTSNWDLIWGGITYKGAYGLGQISPVTDKPGEIQGISLDIFGDSINIALALDGSDEVQGSACTIRTAILDPTTYLVLDAPIDWVGALDTMAIVEDGLQATVRVTAESKAVGLLRGSPTFYNDADQRLVNGFDASFVYQVDQLDKPVIWPAREYFFQ